MSYQHNNSGYNYGAPPPSSPQPPYSYPAPPPSSTQPPPSTSQPPYSYAAPPPSSTQRPYSSAPYAAPPPSASQPPYAYAAPPPSSSQPSYSSAPYAAPPPSTSQPPYAYAAPPPTSAQPAYSYNQQPPPYGGAPPTSSPSAPPYAQAPSHYAAGYPPQSSAFAPPVASAFPPGSDPNLIACFQIADRDRSGFIDDKELQAALSSYNQSFSIRTVHLLMYTFTNTNTRVIGPKEFTSVFYSLQNWRSIFERFDRDRSGKIDVSELREALLSLGFSVSSGILELLVSKFDKSGGKNRAIEYDHFIECCLTVKGLTEKFKEKDPSYTGSASFTYEAFMMAVLPFLIA